MTKKEQYSIAAGYAYIHFAVEVICFYTMYRVFAGSPVFWSAALLMDTLAFAPQSLIGAMCEAHPWMRPGPIGSLMLIAGAALCCIQTALTIRFLGLALFSLGNAFVHIAGALSTLRVSNGRLSESAVFVGGGSFGLITGRLLGQAEKSILIPVLFMLLAFAVSLLIDHTIRKEYGAAAFRFDEMPCAHVIAADHAPLILILLLTAVIVVRAYIGYYLPTSWNQTKIQAVFLFCSMGTGKMLGGILADHLGAKTVGVISCLAAVPALLFSDQIMWLSLIGVALFSMTMAITLGGLVSILPKNPGTAFGVTTIGLLLGTLPTFFIPSPGQILSNILIAVLSAAAALILLYCIKNKDPMDPIK